MTLVVFEEKVLAAEGQIHEALADTISPPDPDFFQWEVSGVAEIPAAF